MTDRLGAALLLVLLFFFAAPATAQSSSYQPYEPLPLGSALLTLPSPHVAATGIWEARFAHRFAEARGEGIHSLWGLDNGANVTMGLGWVPRRDLELSIVRSSVLDTWEAAAKYVVVQEARSIPLSLTVRAGVDVRSERGIEDRTSPFAQASGARRFGDRLELFAMPARARHAGRATLGERSYALFDDAFNVPFAAAFLLSHGLTLLVEFVPPNGDLPGGGDPGWSAGLKKAVGGHHFELILTNSAATTTDQIVSSTYLGEPLDAGGLRIGFNIERQFGRARRSR